jgi:hypothetical protein
MDPGLELKPFQHKKLQAEPTISRYIPENNHPSSEEQL